MFPGRRGAGRIFYNQVQLSRAGPADLPALRAERGRRRVHPGVLRRRRHGRGQREHVPRLAAHGRDGHRREGDARGDGRREDALLRLRLRRRPRARPRTRRSRGRAATSAICRRTATQTPPAARAARAEAERQDDRGDHPGRREQVLRHDGRHRRDHRRGLVVRDQAALREGDPHRLRAHRRARRRHRREPAEVARRRALRRLGRQGRALHLALRRVQRAAPLPRRRAGLHDRHEGRAPGHHPRGREDDRRGERGDRAEDQRRRAQGLRRGPLRDVRPGVRARRVHRAAHRVDRRHGAAGRGERGLLQQDPGGPGGPGARRLRREAARRVPRRHRPHEARERARHRRRHPGRSPARRDRDALRALRGEGRAAAEEKHMVPPV